MWVMTESVLKAAAMKKEENAPCQQKTWWFANVWSIMRMVGLLLVVR